MLNRLIGSLVVLVALCCGLAASAQEKVSIAALRFVSSAPIFIAMEKGYFKDKGLDIEFKFFDAAQPIAVAVAAGDADLGITGLTGGFFNLAGKGAIKIIAAQSREEPGYDFVAYVASKKAFDAGFNDPGKFPGKTIAITQTGSTFHYMLGMLSEKRGFKLTDVTLKPLQSIANVTAALKGEQVDGALLPANNAYAAEKEGFGKIIGWVHQETPWQLGALFAGSRVVDQRRATVEKFMAAYVMACADYAEAFLQRDAAGKRVFGEKADALIPMIQKYVEPKPSPDQVKASASYIDPQGRLLVKNIYDQVTWYQAQGMVARDVDAGKFLDLSFVKDHLDPPKR
ncbi:ABC transporter substrate-binding protein [Reyranella sp. CPCC 100927]|uniref:ABC transporter substrate-binding protein n=1 Tax=Reyranella sp. CPCC 100927 TaxID=2599616 RepID=UPI0011B3FC6A|nr:ABC transporter substrate-binding protein [Reyranella sp. CPCC 100927]TWT09932.1 ABC transporter substrate-binding protein [Reyranella sp. CPCC 100927]